MKNYMRNNKGITITTLVVTVIIMLILSSTIIMKITTILTIMEIIPMWMIIVFVHIVVVNWILTQKQALSGGTYHNCPNCGLEFREDNTNLTLTNAHEGTRARNKYLYKSFTIGEWQNIFSDNLSNSEINEIWIILRFYNIDV